MVIEAFKENIVPLSKKSQYKKQVEEKEEKKRKDDLKEFANIIAKEETKGIDRTFLKNYFSCQSATAMLKDLVNSDRDENIDLVVSIQKKVSDLMDDYLGISDEEEVKNKRLDTTISIVGKILEFNKQRRRRIESINSRTNT